MKLEIVMRFSDTVEEDWDGDGCVRALSEKDVFNPRVFSRHVIQTFKDFFPVATILFYWKSDPVFVSPFL